MAGLVGLIGYDPGPADGCRSNDPSPFVPWMRDAEVPVPEQSEPGFIVRYSITRIGGIGPSEISPAL